MGWIITGMKSPFIGKNYLIPDCMIPFFFEKEEFRRLAGAHPSSRNLYKDPFYDLSNRPGYTQGR